MTDIIRVDGLSKRYPFTSIPKQATIKDAVIRSMKFEKSSAYVDALCDVNFSVERGSLLGIIGRNGSGKTTLMRIMASILAPDSGTVQIDGTVTLLSLGMGFHPDLTGREGARIELLTMGLTPRDVERVMPGIIEFSEIAEFIDLPVRTYSSGMLMRLAFAVAVCVDPDVLLLDEILAVGDERFSRKCMACIDEFRQRGKTIVLVSHDADLVAGYSDVALWLDRGHVAGFGDPRAVVAAYHALSDDPAAAEPVQPVFDAPEAAGLNPVEQQ